MTETAEITVLIADDHEVVREGLRLSLLRSSRDPRRRRGLPTARPLWRSSNDAGPTW